MVQRAYLVRAALGYELAADLRIVGRSSSPATRRLQKWADARGLTADIMELDDGDDTDPRLRQMCLSEADLPVVRVTSTGAMLYDSDDAALDQALQSDT